MTKAHTLTEADFEALDAKLDCLIGLTYELIYTTNDARCILKGNRIIEKANDKIGKAYGHN